MVILKRIFILFLAMQFVAACPATTGSVPSRQFQLTRIEGIGDSPNFPLRVGGFRRGDILNYEPGAVHISVAYNLYEPDRQAASTVYLFPVADPTQATRETLESHFAGVKRTIERVHPGANGIAESRVKIMQETGPIDGLWVAYRYRQVFAGLEQEVLSEAYLFQRGDRFIKFSHTYPYGQRDMSGPAVRRLMESLNWVDPDPLLKPGRRI